MFTSKIIAANRLSAWFKHKKKRPWWTAVLILLLAWLWLFAANRPPLRAQTAVSFPFFDDFESGTLGSGWTTNEPGGGRVQVSTAYPYAGSYSVLLDDSAAGFFNSTSAIILTIDLTAQADVSLSFWWREFDDQNHAQDGVFISDDLGANWYQVLSFNDGPNSYRQDVIDIVAAASANGLTLNNQFQIKFQFYGNQAIPNDGYAIDDVRVYSVATPTPTPTSTATPTPTPTPTPTATPTPPSPNPHGNYGATTDTCAACHRTHTAPSPSLINTAVSGNAFCYTCHDGTGAPASPPVSTHANTGFTGGVEAAFDLQCTQCHDPHGAPNLSAVKQFPIVQPGGPLITTGPVNFAATSGPNSYDDGLSVESSRICVTCHVNSDNSGYPMVNHTGGIHQAGFNFTGQDCTSCHRHSADADAFTDDGFMPLGGCTLCHAGPIDNGDGIPAGGRRGVVNEFSATSKHGPTAVTDNDCLACHNTDQHTQGFVQVYDADNPATVITLNNDLRTNPAEQLKLEPFCLACHDGDGAGGLPPFSDSQAPPAIANALWTNATHSTNYTCFDCHDNGHGSVKNKLLAPFDAVADASPADPLRQEERFCYQCHDGSVTAVNMEAVFNQATRHTVELDAPNSYVECVDCHNPHTNNSIEKTANPDDNSQLWPAGEETGFCLACHDGDPPPGVVFPASSPGTGFDKSTYLNTTHDTNLRDYGCQHCHEQHGSDNVATLLDTFIVTDYNPYTYGDGDYALCFSCHVEADLVEDSGGTAANNAFEDLHQTHVRDEDASCVVCHDAHAPWDVGEAGLISFDVALRDGYDDYNFSFWGGRDLSSAFNESTGRCYVACHDRTHTNSPQFAYSASPNPSLDCTTCHPGGPPPPAASVILSTLMDDSGQMDELMATAVPPPILSPSPTPTPPPPVENVTPPTAVPSSPTPPLIITATPAP